MQPGYQVGNREAEQAREKAARDEAEAWKLAQLAAVLAAGDLARDKPRDASDHIQDASRILAVARDLVQRRGEP